MSRFGVEWMCSEDASLMATQIEGWRTVPVLEVTKNVSMPTTRGPKGPKDIEFPYKSRNHIIQTEPFCVRYIYIYKAS